MHKPVGEIIRKLNKKLRGHYVYYGITDNRNKLEEFRDYVKVELKRVLNRRSQKANMTWEKFGKVLKYNPIAKSKIYHSLI